MFDTQRLKMYLFVLPFLDWLSDLAASPMPRLHAYTLVFYGNPE